MLLLGCNASQMTAPSGKLTARFFSDKDGKLGYTVIYDGQTVCDSSSLGVSIDGIPLYENVELKAISESERNETYAVRGAHDTAHDHAREYRYQVTHRPTGYAYTLEARLYDDGFAYRMILPGQGPRRVDGEAAQWRLPQQSRVWFAERNSDWKLRTYAGEWISSPAYQLATVSSQGPIQTMPLLYQTDNGPYLMVSEAALYNYSGMRLRASSEGSLHADFTEKEGFTLHDTITTPWRVLIVANDLNALVNTDLITNLSPAPDPALFADTSWIRPGRSLWSWWSGIDGRFMTVEGERAVIDLAAEFGYEYSTLDEGWEKFPEKWKTLRELASCASQKNVGLFVWRHWEQLNDPAEEYSQMRNFMDSVAACGVKGLKIDFMNGEGIRQIDFTTHVLQNAAARRLLVNLHGCQKPSGEARTYPNELTREGVRGIELNRITANYLERIQAEGKDLSGRSYVPGNENQDIPASHNTALPFTRCVVGSADYTPIAFSMPGEVLPAQQLSCAYLICSSLTVVAENPFYLLRDERLQPALKFIQELPVCWSETIVMPQSSIGSLAAFARRDGKTWYLAVATTQSTQQEFSLSFLGAGKYTMTLLEDGDAGSLRTTNQQVDATSTLPLNLRIGGGAVARFTLE